MLSSFYRVSPAQKPPLRIGILLDSPNVPELFLNILEDIRQASFAQIELIVDLKRCSRARRDSLLFRLYDRWDGSRADRAGDPFELVDIPKDLAGVERVEAELSDEGELSPAAVEVISSKRLDMLLSMATHPLRGGLLESARYGVWAYQFGDGERYDGSLPYFWEVRDGNSLCGVRLCVLSDGPGGSRVLREGLFSSHSAENISWRANRLRPGWASTSFVIQKLFEIHSSDRWAADSISSTCLPSRSETPSNSDMVRWLAPKIAGKAVRRLMRGARTEHWRMAVRVGAQRLWTNERGADTTGFQWIPSAPGHLYADPFLLQRQGRTWLFYEHYRYAEQRAVIDCAEVLPDGQLAEARQVLQQNYHLSFPHVFEHEGDVFMIPETGGNRTVQLYRAVNFPYEWKLEKVLLQGHWVVDTAVWHDGRLWWFFATMKEPRGEGTMLILFSATHLTGEWRYHPANPICTDVRSIRGAGAVFLQNGKLLRPSQDCGVRYGHRLNFHEITALTPEEYREEPAFVFDPTNWAGLVGVHTYNQCPGVEVVDGCVLATKAETGGYAGALIAPQDLGPAEAVTGLAKA